MKHIIIRNLGPIESAEVELKQYNVIIGPQSTGKSCVLKTVCFCRWVEKSIFLSQTSRDFISNDAFLTHLISFHKLDEYIKSDTYIEYESDYTKFSFDNSRNENNKLLFEWKEENRWNYKRPQISYIPAERNLVAVIPNWMTVNLPKGNILSFMSEWNEARHLVKNSLPILDLGVSYKYDSISDRDLVIVGDTSPINFTNTSSGLHALIPLYVHIDYLTRVKPTVPVKASVQVQEAEIKLQARIVLYLIRKYQIKPMDIELSDSKLIDKEIVARFGINNSVYPFSQAIYSEYLSILNRLQKTQHFEFFIEEPEENLFPITQTALMGWLKKIIDGNNANLLFIATHSPHILQYFIENKAELNLMRFEDAGNGRNKMVTLTREQVDELRRMGSYAYFMLDWCVG